MYIRSDSNDEYYSWKDFEKKLTERDEPVTDFLKFIVDKYGIDIKQDFDTYIVKKDYNIKELQDSCTHSNVIVKDCPKVRGNYVHISHRSNCMTCYNLICVECDKKFICENCYNDKKGENSDDDNKYKVKKYEDKYCEKCNRTYTLTT